MPEETYKIWQKRSNPIIEKLKKWVEVRIFANCEETVNSFV